MLPERQSRARAAIASLPIACALVLLLLPANAGTGRGCRPRLRRVRARASLLADCAVEGGTVARHLRHGEAACRRASADRAQGKDRGPIVRHAGRAALFLVRRNRRAGGRHVASEAHARGRHARLPRGHPRDRGRAQRAAKPSRRQGRLARTRSVESPDRKSVLGMDREAVRRAARRRADVEVDGRRAARPIAQCPVQPSRP